MLKLSASLILGVSLAIGLMGSALIGADAFKTIRRGTIAVKGLAEKRIRSDMAVWKGTVVARDSSLAGAYRKLEKDILKAREFMEKQGFPAERIVLTSVAIHTVYAKGASSYASNQVQGYRLEQGLQIESKEVDRITELSHTISNLISQGVELQASPAEYYYTNIDGLKVELLGAAAKDARVRADQLARSSGGRVGELKNASQGVFQITQPNSTEVSGYGIYDTTTIDKNVKVVLTVDYSVL